MADKNIRVGRIAVEHFRDSIRLRWTHNGRTYCKTIGKNSKDTVKAAKALAQTIDADITFQRFDNSLAKYGFKAMSVEALKVIQDDITTQLSVFELWVRFYEDKKMSLKPKTEDSYNRITNLLNKLGDKASWNSIKTKQELLSITTTDQARRVLIYLNAASKWGVRHKFIESNPFEGMANEMPKPSYLTQPKPNAFTEEEKQAVLDAFKTSKHYSHYYYLVAFWLGTGCRPSEALSLTWDNFNQNFTQVTFDGSIQITRCQGLVFSKGSKTNKIRTVPLSTHLSKLLAEWYEERRIICSEVKIVFPSPSGGFINYYNFLRRGWHTVVDPIKKSTTPYSCRDTFITHQLLKGVPTAVVAKWCDNSGRMIEKYYFDSLQLGTLQPLE